MIDRKHDLPITKQADVLRISRGSVYYLPQAGLATDLEVMRRLDRYIWSFLLLARGCCEACWLPRGARSAVGMSKR